GTPLVSVVTSVYNGEKYLRSSLRSILQQEGVDFELIVVNDGSNDRSGMILKEMAENDERIHLIERHNKGLTSSLIEGCSKARGTYIARHDTDDISLPDRLKTLAEMLEQQSELVFASSWAEVIGPEDELLYRYTRPAGAEAATRMLLETRTGPPGHGSVMFRKDAYEAVGGYREQMYYAQDSDLWLRFGLIGKLGYAQEVLYRYRVSHESISGALHFQKLAYAELITQLFEVRKSGGDETALLDQANQLRSAHETAPSSSQALTLYFIGRSLFDRKDERAARYLAKCVRERPLQLKAWLLLVAATPRMVFRAVSRSMTTQAGSQSGRLT
ncbi:MAG: glycosyltransferase, partial [Anaerolineales bacterium]|nr:glycosyltransferase [Anaerolineales bacterium]